MTSATPCWRRQMSSPSRWTSPAPWSTTAATHSPPTLEMRKTRKWEAVGKNEAADKQRTVLRNSSMTNDNSCFPFFATPTSTPSPRGDFFFFFFLIQSGYKRHYCQSWELLKSLLKCFYVGHLVTFSFFPQEIFRSAAFILFYFLVTYFVIQVFWGMSCQLYVQRCAFFTLFEV